MQLRVHLSASQDQQFQQLYPERKLKIAKTYNTSGQEIVFIMFHTTPKIKEDWTFGTVC